MIKLGKTDSLNTLIQTSTQALYHCKDSMCTALDSGKTTKTKDLASTETHLLLNLMETLVDTKNQLSHAISMNRVSLLNTQVIKAMEMAILNVIANPLDSKVNQIYLSIFAYNTPLWNVLKEMQKLLQTVEFLKDRTGRRVTKVAKKNRERRKKRHEKDILIQNSEE